MLPDAFVHRVQHLDFSDWRTPRINGQDFIDAFSEPTRSGAIHPGRDGVHSIHSDARKSCMHAVGDKSSDFPVLDFRPWLQISDDTLPGCAIRHC
jgi:hypothetical protein